MFACKVAETSSLQYGFCATVSIDRPASVRSSSAVPIAPANSSAWSETQGFFDVLNSGIKLTCPAPKDTTQIPPARKARVQRQRMVYQGDHRIDVLAKIGERARGIYNDVRIITGDLMGSP
jgi:hypothetical protein